MGNCREHKRILSLRFDFLVRGFYIYRRGCGHQNYRTSGVMLARGGFHGQRGEGGDGWFSIGFLKRNDLIPSPTGTLPQSHAAICRHSGTLGSQASYAWVGGVSVLGV